MATNLETLLSNLLVPDSEVIQQATQQLMLVCRDPSIILQLCHVLTMVQDPKVRRYGAVLLRRRITEKKQWNNLPVEFKQHLRFNIIDAVIEENDESVRNALVQIVAAVAKHELSRGWAELFAFLDEFTESRDATKRELGLYVLSHVAQVANKHLKPHLLGLSELFEQAFLDDENRMCQYNAILSMTHLVRQIGTDEQGRFQKLIIPLLQAIRGLISEDEEKACEALEIFDKLMESDVVVFGRHVKGIVGFCSEIAANQNFGNAIRVRAMWFFTWLTKRKKESILKHKLVEPVLKVMFTIMCEPHDEDDEDQQNEMDEDVESSDPYSYASQVVYIMALHFPSRKIVPKMMSLIKRALRSPNPHHKKAGYMALGVIVDGCSTIIRDKYLDVCLQRISSGIRDPNPIVHNSALFALSQFFENMQLDISKFTNELIPLLLNYLREGHAANATDSSLRETYHALDILLKNMGKEILPYLTPLMEQLLSGLSENTSPKIRELSIGAIGSIAIAAKEGIALYIYWIMEHLEPFINANYQEEMLPLQIKVFDTLHTLYEVLGDEHSRSFVHVYIQLGIHVMTATKDPNVKTCVYGRMKGLASLLENNYSEFLQPIVNQMVESLKSNEDVSINFNKEQEDWLKLFDVEDLGTNDTESDDEEDSEIQSYSVETAYLKEKEEACISLGEIALDCEQAFMPYIEHVYEEMFKMLDHHASKVRQASAFTCVELCVCLAKSVRNGIQDATPLMMMVSHLLPKLLTCIRQDVDIHVVTETLVAVKVLLDEVEEPVLANPDHLPAISDCLRCVLSKKTACQDAADKNPELGFELSESKCKHILIKRACDIILALIRVQKGENNIFLITAILPDLVKRLKYCSSKDLSCTIKTVAEIVDALGEQTEVFAEQLYAVITHSLQHVANTVRSSAIYAVGILAKNGGQTILTKYDKIFKVLLRILAIECDEHCRDDVCVALCRMLLKCPQMLPVDQIVPVVLRELPLKENFGENSTIFECLNSLYVAEQKSVVQNLSRILSMIARVLADGQDTNDCKGHMARLVRRAAKKQPEVMRFTLATLKKKQKRMLNECLRL